METLGQRLRSARESLGLNQEKLGQMIGVRQQTIARWESDEATPRPRRMDSIAEALHTTAANLQYGDDVQSATDRTRLTPNHDKFDDPFAESIASLDRANREASEVNRRLRLADQHATEAALDLAETEFNAVGCKVSFGEYGSDLVVACKDRTYKVTITFARETGAVKGGTMFSFRVPRRLHYYDYLMIPFVLNGEAHVLFNPCDMVRNTGRADFSVNMIDRKIWLSNDTSTVAEADYCVDNYALDAVWRHAQDWLKRNPHPV